MAAESSPVAAVLPFAIQPKQFLTRRNKPATIFAGFILLIGALLSQTSLAAGNSHKINDIKAAFIINIARFVSWPADTAQQLPDIFRLCLYRETLPGRTLSILTSKTIGGRRVVPRQIDSLETPPPCDMIFVPEQELPGFAGQYQQSNPPAALVIADLTAGDLAGKTHNGVMVALVRKGQTIGFEVNIGAARQAGLSFRSELLKLATIVDQGP